MHIQSIYCPILLDSLLSSEVLHHRICHAGSNLSITLIRLDLLTNRLILIPGGVLFEMISLQYLNLSPNQMESLRWQCHELSDGDRDWKHGLISIATLDLSNNHILDLGYLPVACSGCNFF